MLFNNAKGKPHARAIANLFSDFNVIDKIFRFADPVERTRKLSEAIDSPIRPREVSQDEAPSQETVITADLCDQDHFGVVTKEHLDEAVPPFEDRALIDVALVGNLVGVEIRRFLQQQSPADP